LKLVFGGKVIGPRHSEGESLKVNVTMPHKQQPRCIGPGGPVPGNNLGSISGQTFFTICLFNFNYLGLIPILN